MNKDIRTAMLGDHEAAKRLTDAGVLVSCKKHQCGAYGCAHQTKKNAVAYWNTRAPILSSREMEMLEGME